MHPLKRSRWFSAIAMVASGSITAGVFSVVVSIGEPQRGQLIRQTRHDARVPQAASSPPPGAFVVARLP